MTIYGIRLRKFLYPQHRYFLVHNLGLNFNTGYTKMLVGHSYRPFSFVKREERKRKAEYLYSAYSTSSPLKALRHGSHSFTCKLDHAFPSIVSIHQMAPPLTEAAYIQ